MSKWQDIIAAGDCSTSCREGCVAWSGSKCESELIENFVGVLYNLQLSDYWWAEDILGDKDKP